MIDNIFLVNAQQLCVVNQLHDFAGVCFAVVFSLCKGNFVFFSVPLKNHGDESFEASINFFCSN